MMTSGPSSPRVKGQLRCFECRSPCPVKEGFWLVKQGQQIFLCKKCKKLPLDSLGKAPTAAI